MDRETHHRLGAPRLAGGLSPRDALNPAASATAHAASADAAARPRWRGRLALRYTRDGARTLAHDRHDGPLRVLQRLYPEGPGICHHVLVHPPGGMVGGDRLEIDVEVGDGAHALVTTPSATRWYRSAGAAAHQQARLRLGRDARLEWLPLENIAYRGCLAHNEVSFELAAGAELIGWDLTALGLPAAGQPFDAGCYAQRLQWPGRWLERARLDAADRLLFASPLGLAGRAVIATIWWAGGDGAPARAEPLLAAARESSADDGAGPDAAVLAGVTSPQPGLVVLRLLADAVEPALQRLAAVRAAWRRAAWDLAAEPPRIWRT